MDSASPRNDLIPIRQEFQGFIYPAIDCRDYDTFAALPRVIEFRGKLYQRAGYNSDTGNLSYRRMEPDTVAKNALV